MCTDTKCCIKFKKISKISTKQFHIISRPRKLPSVHMLYYRKYAKEVLDILAVYLFKRTLHTIVIFCA